ncbi:MAG TPA: GNAT family N-acetyltransferase [Kofleriaceae bacterium]
MIELRTVQRADVGAVLALVADVLGEFGLEFGKGSSTDTELEDLPDSYLTRGGAFWVAVQGDELLGTCAVFPITADEYELRKMYLRGASRGLGLGKRMLDRAIEWTRAQRGVRLVLDTAETMTRAIAFYEANGFVRDDTYIRGPRCSRGYVRVL